VNDVAELVHDVEPAVNHTGETVRSARSSADPSRTPAYDVSRVEWFLKRISVLLRAPLFLGAEYTRATARTVPIKPSLASTTIRRFILSKLVDFCGQ
jgi:hypothetical protein